MIIEECGVVEYGGCGVWGSQYVGVVVCGGCGI